MINDPQCDNLIAWSDNGQSFIIMDPPKFSQELSKYFKHNNLSSFIRQLNMYGFRKVATIENSGLHPVTDDLHFYHPDFVKGKPERLEAIKRKLPQKIAESIDLRNVIKGISEIEDKQKGVSKTLADIKRENEMLWAELHELRQKHQQQQLYISGLMKLVFEAMEQNGIKTNMLQLKRNSPLMIEGSDDSHIKKKSRLISSDDCSATAYSVPTTSFENTLPSETSTTTEQPQQNQHQLHLQQHFEQPQLQTQVQPQDLQNQESLATIQLPPEHFAYTGTEGLTESDFDVHGNLALQSAPSLDTPKIDAGGIETSDIESSFRLLEETINCNGEQIDTLVPSIIDFTEENLDELFPQQ